jgi:hypothetical protein
MGFVLLLILSLSSLIRVELYSSTVSRDLDVARENAILGMQIAVARLQESVGPDQRFTATSALTGATANANITGVWKEGETSAFTWLVSGNDLSNPLAVKPSTLSPASTDADEGEVFLVDFGTVSAAEDRIKLPKQSLSSNTSKGHYAYWIGDEGVKVSMGINDETDRLDYDNTRVEDPVDNGPASGHDWSEAQYREELRQMVPSIPNFWMPLGLDFGDVAGSQKLASLSSVSSASLLSSIPSSTVLREHFHSLTPLSRAVLVNHTVEGGALRHDLSDSPQTEGTIKRFTRGRPVELASGNQGFQTLPYRGAAYSDIFPHVSTGPVITEFLIRYGFYRDSQGRLAMKEEVQVEFWNPYTFPIETSQKMTVNIENMPVFTVSVNGESYDVAVDDYLKSTWVEGPMVLADMEWEPGEIKWLKGSTGHSGFSLTTDGPSRSVVILDSNGNEVEIPDPETSGTPITIEVTAPAITDANRFSVTLQTYDPIAVYTPQIDYKALDVANTSPTLSSEWLFGYAFEMDDDLERWVNGAREDAADPRRFDLDYVDFADHDFDYWSDDPADILGDINLTGFDTFNTQQNYILYDIATQEPVSVGSLTNLISTRPQMLGNSWGESANEHFDRYFFSSLPRWYEWDLSAPPLLPNRYIEYFLTGQDTIEIGDKYASSGLDVDMMFDVYHAAKYLMIRGAFNINSTSVDAWRAMLSGIHIQDWSQGDEGAVRDLDYAFFRHSFNGQFTPTPPDETIAASNAFSRSGVTLTEDQVNSLANAVVALILERGHPFESLSEFLNAGIIEQAIEAVEINKAAEGLGIVPNSSAYLTQADVIKTIAPMITPRSDTFLVRSYGDVTHPVTGEVTASVWCEAVVQRTPELTTPVSGVIDLARDPLSPDVAKYPYGRKMKILSIRFLNPDEV